MASGQTVRPLPAANRDYVDDHDRTGSVLLALLKHHNDLARRSLKQQEPILAYVLGHQVIG